MRTSRNGPSGRESHLLHALHGVSNGVLIGSAVGVVLGLAVVSGDGPEPTSEHPGYAQRLAQVHHCWTDRAPPDMEGQVPGGTVMKPAGALVPVYAHTHHAVSVALAHVFQGTHPDVVVYAFCR